MVDYELINRLETVLNNESNRAGYEKLIISSMGRSYVFNKLYNSSSDFLSNQLLRESYVGSKLFLYASIASLHFNGLINASYHCVKKTWMGNTLASTMKQLKVDQLLKRDMFAALKRLKEIINPPMGEYAIKVSQLTKARMLLGKYSISEIEEKLKNANIPVEKVVNVKSSLEKINNYLSHNYPHK